MQAVQEGWIGGKEDTILSVDSNNKYSTKTREAKIDLIIFVYLVPLWGLAFQVNEKNPKERIDLVNLIMLKYVCIHLHAHKYTYTHTHIERKENLLT